MQKCTEGWPATAGKVSLAMQSRALERQNFDEALQTLPTSASRPLQVIVTHAAQMFDAPYARIWVAAHDGLLRCAAAHGFVHERTFQRRLEPDSVSGLASRQEILELCDAPGHRGWRVTRDFGRTSGLRTYVGVRLSTIRSQGGVFELMR